MHERARKKTRVDYGSVRTAQLAASQANEMSRWGSFPDYDNPANRRFDPKQSDVADIESRMRQQIGDKNLLVPPPGDFAQFDVPSAITGDSNARDGRALGHQIDEEGRANLESRMQKRGGVLGESGLKEISGPESETEEEINFGAVYNEPPPEHVKLYSAGNMYVYGGGFYYKMIYSEDTVRYLVVTPPPGTIVYDMPEDCMLAEGFEEGVHFSCKGTDYKKVYSEGEIGFVVVGQ